MTIATTATITSQVNNFVKRDTLARAMPNLPYSNYGIQESIPANFSKTIKRRRYERLAPTLGTQLGTLKSVVEGATPSDTSFSITDISVTLAQYGNLLRWSDQAQWTSYENVDKELMKLNRENLQQTTDIVNRDGISAGSTVLRALDSAGNTTGSRASIAGKINAPILDKAIRTLKLNDARFHTKQVNASTKINTTAIRPAFVSITSPYNENDLEQVNGYIPVAQYSDLGDVMKGEIGCYKNVRFISSTLTKQFADAGAAVAGTFSTTGSNNDVFATLIFGEEAYMTVSLAGHNADIKYVPGSSPDSGNPLGQWSSLGWTAMLASQILNDAWILRLETAATA